MTFGEVLLQVHHQFSLQKNETQKSVFNDKLNSVRPSTKRRQIWPLG